MTIPIQTPQIGPTAVLPANGPLEQIVSGFNVIQLALQKRAELQQAQQELAQRREQFELNRKLIGTQIAGAELDQEKKKRDMKAEEDRLVARSDALRIFTGSIPELNTPEGIGQVIAGIKDPLVAAEFYTLLQESQKANAAVAPNYQFRDAGTPSGTGTEVVAFDPRNPTKPVRTGVPGAPDAGARRIPVVTEREKASVAIMTAAANATINRLETADPTIPSRLAKKLRDSRAIVGTLAKRLAGMSADDIALLQEQQIEQKLSEDPALLEYYQAQKAYLGPTLFGLSGKVVTGRDYTTQAPTFFAMGASNPQVLTARRKARAQRTRSFAIEAGDAMAERLAELQNPEEYGFGTVTLPDSTVVPITPGKARYHPRFRP